MAKKEDSSKTETKQKNSNTPIVLSIIGFCIIVVGVIVWIAWGSAQERKQEAFVKAYLGDLELRLELYKEEQTLEPKTYPPYGKYSDLVSALTAQGLITERNDLAFIPKSVDPVEGYDYYYCSSDGSDYLLEARKGEKVIHSLGSDNCTPKK